MTNEELQDFKNSVGQGEPLSLFQQATSLEENERLQKELYKGTDALIRQIKIRDVEIERYRKALEEIVSLYENWDGDYLPYVRKIDRTAQQALKGE